MSDSDSDDGFAAFGNIASSDDEEEEEILAPCDHADRSEPWLKAFCSHEEPMNVVKGWLMTLSDEAVSKIRTQQDKHEARSQLKNDIMASKCRGVAVDKNDAYKYMGSILRECDAALKCEGKKGFAIEKAKKGVKNDRAVEVLKGDGSPGTLGIYWSNLAAAQNGDLMKSYGVTHRLNLAAEVTCSAF